MNEYEVIYSVANIAHTRIIYADNFHQSNKVIVFKKTSDVYGVPYVEVARFMTDKVSAILSTIKEIGINPESDENLVTNKV